jgi:hypothetical protein
LKPAVFSWDRTLSGVVVVLLAALWIAVRALSAALWS